MLPIVRAFPEVLEVGGVDWETSVEEGTFFNLMAWAIGSLFEVMLGIDHVARLNSATKSQYTRIVFHIQRL